MPCKNAAPYLEKCIQSILDQTYTQWELLICDDHSSDQSPAIAQDYAKQHAAIFSLTNKGKGIIDALQTAYEQSRGGFVTRMDADDLMPSNKLRVLLSLLKEQKSDRFVSTGKVRYFPEQEIKPGFKAYEQWLNGLVTTESHWNDIYKECVIPSPCWMMQRNAFDSIGGFSQSEYPEDYHLTWRMFLGNIKVVASDKVLHLWRDHPDRTSRNSEVYQTQTYFDLKIGFMLSMPLFQNSQLVVWGAGKKGKALVKILLKKGILPVWVCNNPNKIGREIYEVTLKSFTDIPNSDGKMKILLTVSSLDDQRDVYQFLHHKGYQKSLDYFILA